MSETAIRAEGVSKRYRIGLPKAGSKTLRDSLMALARRPVDWLRRNGQPGRADDTIWALRDVSFEVESGEAVGVIGRNGAGKSTLLKILSRITDPTEGYVEIYGQVGSLLEVGTGFHQELTGRENIFLNGAIIGMRRAEIERKFDEMVDFSGVEKFIDTPVKFYSSGMKVRLAFAVAAHLDPEILFVDEVLAVGDATFQEKCLRKMGEVAGGGRTVMFVSHNLTAISGLCERSLYLESGELVAAGETQAIIEQYLRTVRAYDGVPLAERQDRGGNGRMRFTAACLQDAAGKPIAVVRSGQEVRFVLEYLAQAGTRLDDVEVRIKIENAQRQKLVYFSSRLAGADWTDLPPAGRLVCVVPELPLAPGQYVFNLVCHQDEEMIDDVANVGSFDIAWGDYFGTGRVPRSKWGPLLVRHGWRLEA